MELEGIKRRMDTRKSRRTRSVPTVLLCLAALNRFQGCFAQKMAGFGPKKRTFGTAPPDLAGELGAQTLDLGRPCVDAEDGWSRVEPKALGWSNGQNGKEKRLLLVVVACCCPLARFMGRGVW